MNDYWAQQAYHNAMVPCSAMHPNSCEKDAMIKLIKVFNMAIRLYGPLHMLPFIIFKRKALMKRPLAEIYILAKNILRSTLFLSIYVSSFWYGTCIFKNLSGHTGPSNVICAAVMCSFAILLEPAKRRVEIALFMLPRFFE